LLFPFKLIKMEIRISTKQILRILLVLSWIIFAGLGIEAGGFITKTFANLVLPPEDAAKFWRQADLTALYRHNQSQYVMLASIVIITTVLKALMFYFIVRILHSKELNLSKPFNNVVRRFLLIIAYLALGIGIFSLWGSKFSGQLISQGVAIPDIQQLRLGGADVWLFMAVILFVIAQIFKRGIEIQSENELTV
jgi:hypothetical protein